MATLQGPLDGRRVGAVPRTAVLGAGTHLDSYLDSDFSSQAVFPPPKFFFAVSTIPCGGRGHGLRLPVPGGVTTYTSG